MPSRTPIFPTPDSPYYVPATTAYNNLLLHVLRVLEQNRDAYYTQKRRSLTVCRAAWNSYIVGTEKSFPAGKYPAAIASAAWYGCLQARKAFHNKKEGN